MGTIKNPTGTSASHTEAGGLMNNPNSAIITLDDTIFKDNKVSVGQLVNNYKN